MRVYTTRVYTILHTLGTPAALRRGCIRHARTTRVRVVRVEALGSVRRISLGEREIPSE